MRIRFAGIIETDRSDAQMFVPNTQSGRLSRSRPALWEGQTIGWSHPVRSTRVPLVLRQSSFNRLWCRRLACIWGRDGCTTIQFSPPIEG